MKPTFVTKFIGIGGVFLLTASAPFASAAIQPQNIHLADVKKNEAYLHEGLFVGGDRAIDGVEVQGIRFSANNPGFDRIVVDLSVFQDGKAPHIQRPPYFQTSIDPHTKQLVFTLWGSPRLAFDSKKIAAAFKKSSAIEKIKILPRLEDESWTFWVDLRTEASVEVFELTNPVRVILDIQKKKN